MSVDWNSLRYGRPVSSVLLDAQYRHQEKVAEVFPALSGLSAAETIQGVPVYDPRHRDRPA